MIQHKTIHALLILCMIASCHLGLPAPGRAATLSTQAKIAVAASASTVHASIERVFGKFRTEKSFAEDSPVDFEESLAPALALLVFRTAKEAAARVEQGEPAATAAATAAEHADRVPLAAFAGGNLGIMTGLYMSVGLSAPGAMAGYSASLASKYYAENPSKSSDAVAHAAFAGGVLGSVDAYAKGDKVAFDDIANRASGSGVAAGMAAVNAIEAGYTEEEAIAYIMGFVKSAIERGNDTQADAAGKAAIVQAAADKALAAKIVADRAASQLSFEQALNAARAGKLATSGTGGGASLDSALLGANALAGTASLSGTLQSTGGNILPPGANWTTSSFGFNVNLGSGAITGASMSGRDALSTAGFSVSGGTGSVSGSGFSATGFEGTMTLGGFPAPIDPARTFIDGTNNTGVYQVTGGTQFDKGSLVPKK